MENFKDKVVYQIYLKSFKDSNQDGVGDLRGIIEKLDYLEVLGVDYLWITPFFVSPQNDNGYDVADYLNIDPRFGTMEDLDELIAEADKRGMGIMLDMVFNHTSTQHAWFQRALAGDSEYMDYYIFKDGRPDRLPTNWESKFGGPAWKYVGHLKKWYLHLFHIEQADLNWDNPKVREELKKLIRFWKEKGVRGFRFDVVNLISKPEVFTDDNCGDGRRFYTDGHHVHEFLKELVRDTGIEEMITVGEMSSTTVENCVCYSNPEEQELSMCFNFHHLKVDYRNGDKWELMKPDLMALKKLYIKWQIEMQEHNGWNALFLCNHDQPRAISRFGNDGEYWKESAKMLAVSIFLQRGTPYIYQGEELGMTNAYFSDIQQYRDVESRNYYKILLEKGKSKAEAIQTLAARSRDNGRTPMQWDGEMFAGFSKHVPWIPVPDNYQKINAMEEEKDPDSILNFYKQLIRLRKSRKVLREGNIAFLYEEHPDVLGYVRYCEGNEIIILCNLRKKCVELKKAFEQCKYILGNYEKVEIGVEGLRLREYECIVLEKNESEV